MFQILWNSRIPGIECSRRAPNHFLPQSLAAETGRLIGEFSEDAQPQLLEWARLDLIKRLWADNGVQKCYSRRREFNVSLRHYFVRYFS